MQEQPAEDQKEQEEPFFAYFDHETNNGVVFDEDLSILEELPVDSLTIVEQTARLKWQAAQSRIHGHYWEPRFLSDTKELLEERLVAPTLVTHYASTRSKPAESRAGRKYAAEIFPWRDFAQGLAEFVQPNIPLTSDPWDRLSVFNMSLQNGKLQKAKSDEREEEIFLVDLLNDSLHTHGLVGPIRSWGPSVGRPDIKTTSVVDGAPRKEDVKVLAEFKSTHNLALPMSAANVCKTYNNAYQAVCMQGNDRTDGWSRVCHPLGQLLGYMADNSRRFGVLSSGTRSYFVRIRKRDDNDEEVVEISDAMFIGQENYLKAWLYIHRLASSSTEPLDKERLKWETTLASAGTLPKKPPSPTRKQPCRAKRSRSDRTDDAGGPDDKRAKTWNTCR